MLITICKRIWKKQNSLENWFHFAFIVELHLSWIMNLQNFSKNIKLIWSAIIYLSRSWSFFLFIFPDYCKTFRRFIFFSTFFREFHLKEKIVAELWMKKKLCQKMTLFMVTMNHVESARKWGSMLNHICLWDSTELIQLVRIFILQYFQRFLNLDNLPSCTSFKNQNSNRTLIIIVLTRCDFMCKIQLGNESWQKKVKL